MPKDVIHTTVKHLEKRTSITPIFSLGAVEKTDNTPVKIELILTRYAVNRLREWINFKQGVAASHYDVGDNCIKRILRATDDGWQQVAVTSADLGEF